jgi:Dolichyl-phosphate-mannose-protein mannosyltransferase
VTRMSHESRWLLAATAALTALRLYAATQVGFGDSEALYAAYSLHPQACYRDHPGLIAMVGSLFFGESASGLPTAPAPFFVHIATTFSLAALPWMVRATCLVAHAASGAPSTRESQLRADGAGLIFALTPVTAVGLFGFTPDALLAPLWLAALYCAARGVDSQAPEGQRFGWLVFSGLFGGLSVVAKASGVFLALAIAGWALWRKPKGHAFLLLGLVAGCIPAGVVAYREADAGFPMLAHRARLGSFVGDNLAVASLLQIGKTAFGPALYLSPLCLLLALRELRARVMSQASTSIDELLRNCTLVPGIGLMLVTLLSKQSEPHWTMPAFLSLLVWAGSSPSPRESSRRLLRPTAAIVIAGTFTLATYTWVLAPMPLGFPPGKKPELDISSEMFGWDEALHTVAKQVEADRRTRPELGEQSRPITLVGPHWVICAQLEAGMQRLYSHRYRVACTSPKGDDFADWRPEAHWLAEPELYWVADARFSESPEWPGYNRTASKFSTARMGVPGKRAFQLVHYERIE